MKRLKGKIALITGGNRGIGEAIALRFLEEGAEVAIFGRKEEDNRKVIEKGNKLEKGRIRAYRVDVSSDEEVKKAVKQVKEDFGQIDILVNNAGICRLSKSFEELEDRNWEEMLSVNLYGVIHTTRAVIPFLKERGGKIITIASLAGEVGGIATAADYVASKAALQGTTKSLARELGPSGINVNAIAPGFVKTQMTEKMNINLSSIPLRKVAEPEDIAGAAAFLASDDARLITGTTLDVNGGLYMN
ncbi:SDR family NAD(P)-dependent oxidoreductase [Dialister sp.]|uniref:SDR family NAD(P)-dependent oxidoreductase n=1 Tax=Dialister sp. TaxID=1955814 RepID=UPI003A5C4B5B